MSTLFSFMNQFKAEFKQLALSKTVIRLELTPMEAWSVLSAVQLASRHPDAEGLTIGYASYVALRLQEQVATTPALRTVATLGWGRAHNRK